MSFFCSVPSKGFPSHPELNSKFAHRQPRPPVLCPPSCACSSPWLGLSQLQLEPPRRSTDTSIPPHLRACAHIVRSAWNATPTPTPTPKSTSPFNSFSPCSDVTFFHEASPGCALRMCPPAPAPFTVLAFSLACVFLVYFFVICLLPV